MIHVEAPIKQRYTLGQFFDVWGQPLSREELLDARTGSGEQLRSIVDRRAVTGDPREIDLTAHADIVLEIGPAFPEPTSFSFPPGL